MRYGVPTNIEIDKILFSYHYSFHVNQMKEILKEYKWKQGLYAMKVTKYNDLVDFKKKNRIYWPNQSNNFNMSKLQCSFCNREYISVINKEKLIKFIEEISTKENLLAINEKIKKRNEKIKMVLLKPNFDQTKFLRILLYDEEKEMKEQFILKLENLFENYEIPIREQLLKILNKIVKNSDNFNDYHLSYQLKNNIFEFCLFKKTFIDEQVFNCVIPQNFDNLKQLIIDIHNKKNHVIGFDRIFYEIIKDYCITMPNLKNSITKILKQCEICRRSKVFIRKKVNKSTITLFPLDLIV